ncbi:MAG: hypothetical protein HY683_06440 [Chloroflexi bacterium]|nr:hypothetical protein [Chloroflexota bacterium]
MSVPKGEAAYRPGWSADDLRGFDPWGDAGGDDRDLVAVYLRQADDMLRFRADFLDLRAAVPDLYLALNAAPGGSTALGPGGSPTTGIPWSLLVKVSAGKTAEVTGADFRPVPNAVAAVTNDATLDYVAVDLRRDALPPLPAGPFEFQVLAVEAGGAAVLDWAEPVLSNASVQGRGRMVIRFGNLLGPATPAAVAGWYDSLEADRDGQVKHKGWRYLLDAAEKYWLPMSVDVKQMQYLGWTTDLGLYDRVSALHEAGLLDLPDTLAYGHFMAWQPQDVDAKAIALEQHLYRQAGLPGSAIFYPYEGQVTVADLQTIREAGYEAAIVGAEQDYHGWFGAPMEEAVPAAGKLHRANGIGLVFQRYPWSFVWEPRWGDDPYRDWNEYDIWGGTDGGLHYWFRRNLLDLALSPDQEQFLGLGTDIGVTPWGFQGVADANLRWIAEHPWVQVIRESQLFHQGWKVIDHGDLGLAPDTILPSRFPPMDGALHYNTYFPQFYYGGNADGHSPLIPKGQRIESYADYVPYWRDGLPIPSGRKMGDDRTPGTVIYETLKNLRSAPNNDLTTSAWLFYFGAIGEQTFHSVKDHTPYDADMLRGDVPYGGAYLHPAAKLRANAMRQVNKVLAAARWADAAARGEVPSEPSAETVDLDLDGEDEHVLHSDRLYLVFEDDGGRLEYGFALVPGQGPVQFIAPKEQLIVLLFGPSNWDWTMGEAGQDQVPGSPGMLGAFVEQWMDGTPLAYQRYRVTTGEGQVTFVSPDGKVSKTFSLAREGSGVVVQYRASDEIYVDVQVALDPLRMWSSDWTQSLAEVEGDETQGVRYPDGLGAFLTRAGGDPWLRPGVVSFLDSPARWEWRHDPDRQDYPSGHWGVYPFAQMAATGRGEFTLRLTLEP